MKPFFMIIMSCLFFGVSTLPSEALRFQSSQPLASRYYRTIIKTEDLLKEINKLLEGDIEATPQQGDYIYHFNEDRGVDPKEVKRIWAALKPKILNIKDPALRFRLARFMDLNLGVETIRSLMQEAINAIFQAKKNKEISFKYLSDKERESLPKPEREHMIYPGFYLSVPGGAERYKYFSELFEYIGNNIRRLEMDDIKDALKAFKNLGDTYEGFVYLNSTFKFLGSSGLINIKRHRTIFNFSLGLSHSPLQKALVRMYGDEAARHGYDIFLKVFNVSLRYDFDPQYYVFILGALLYPPPYNTIGKDKVKPLAILILDKVLDRYNREELSQMVKFMKMPPQFGKEEFWSSLIKRIQGKISSLKTSK